jgi:signal transduction histidine kinase
MSLSEKALEELTTALARLRQGDLTASVSFAGQDGALGRLGAEFNETVRALRQRQGSADPKAISKFVHDLKNPLAGIAGVIEIMAQDLPADSPSREVLPDVRAEIEHIKQLLAEFAQGK